MAFDFLPELPKSNLDDRSYEDLLQECILRIPRYCPEWTNYNPSDPGITLLELFAWLTDQMLMRLNQVPRQNYITLLEMLGMHLKPPSPAQTQLTFYLVSDLPNIYTIPRGVEVGTQRATTDQEIIFSTNESLTIGKPSIKHLLTSDIVENRPQILRDRLSTFWSKQNEEWSGTELSVFEEQPQAGNSFYIVFEEGTDLDGNVIALTVKGQQATPTGINPNRPPRRWEAWDGEQWLSILLKEEDDDTQGFSFSALEARGINPLQGTEIILHLPRLWPIAQFGNYRGRWLRCVCSEPTSSQPAYTHSPKIVALKSRAIGGTVIASQCQTIENELLGISDGTQGQTFNLTRTPVLDRYEEEYIIVQPSGELPQRWEEVKDFADSTADDRHYVIDSLSGTVQFGPMIREPSQLQQDMETRIQVQTRRGVVTPSLSTASLTSQYGMIPPRGAKIVMTRYRTGGGWRGNVKAGRIDSLKSAVPYVSRVTNYQDAQGGTDAQTIEQLAVQAPKILRSKDRAVTPEDFEALAIESGKGTIARSRCLPNRKPGVVELLLVPQPNMLAVNQFRGIHPQEFRLTLPLQEQVTSYLDERRLLGINIELQEPDYIGVSVQADISLQPQYDNPNAKAQILDRILSTLYRFLNPITGGLEGKGWTFGQPVYPNDIISLFQQIEEIRYLGAIQLFEIRGQANADNSLGGGDLQWIRLPPTTMINPGSNGLICSWSDPVAAHIINIE